MKKWIILIIAGSFLYLILGALVPFMFQPKVSQEYKDGFSVKNFYNEDGYSVDRADVVETSADALDVRLQMFEEARERIVLSTFDIRTGGSCTDIFSSLIAAADRGVKVQVFVDGMYGALHMKKEPLFYAAGMNPNIEIRFYNEPNLLMPWTANGRMHDKYILIDDKLLLLGGRNTFDYFLGEYTDKNLSYDREVLIYNTAYGTEDSKKSVIDQVYDYFDGIWNSQYSRTVYNKKSFGKDKITKAELELNAHYQQMKTDRHEIFDNADELTGRTVPVNKVTFIHNPVHIYAKEPYVWYQMTELMKAARERVYLQTPYVAFSRDMYRDFKEVGKKDITFEMQINSVAVGDNFMASSDYIFNKDKILDTGVTVYEFQGEHSSHGKSALFDGDLSLIGSYNLDMRSTYVDTETVLVIHGEEFNHLLEGYIMDMHDQSLMVRKDGTYEAKDGAAAKELKGTKKVLYPITSVLFQLFRYLI